MQSGLINKIAATSADVTNADDFRHVCSTGGAVYADKRYGFKPVRTAPKRKGCHDAAIKRNNIKEKNRKKIVGYPPYAHLMNGYLRIAIKKPAIVD